MLMLFMLVDQIFFNDDNLFGLDILMGKFVSVVGEIVLIMLKKILVCLKKKRHVIIGREEGVGKTQQQNGFMNIRTREILKRLNKKKSIFLNLLLKI